MLILYSSLSGLNCVDDGRHDALLITLPKATVAGTAVSHPNVESDQIILPEGKMDLSRW